MRVVEHDAFDARLAFIVIGYDDRDGDELYYIIYC